MKHYVYFLTSSDHRAARLKIGVSVDPTRRMKELQTGNAGQLSLVGQIEAKSRKHAFALEGWWHRLLESVKREGEWFIYNKAVRQLIAAAFVGPVILSEAVEVWYEHVRSERKRFREYNSDINERLDLQLLYKMKDFT